MNLQNLDLSSNKIKTIHSHAFRFNNKLEVLNLSKNNLSFDSDNQPIWDDLTNLKILDLSRNHIKLKEMPYQWKTLARNLHSLNLSDNQIGPELSFQDFDFKQTDLRVNLDDNAIRKITFEDGTTISIMAQTTTTTTSAAPMLTILMATPGTNTIKLLLR